MKVLCVGDVVASAGRALLRRVLPPVKRQYGVDVCIVNGENAADGNGLTNAALEDLWLAGADVVTGGNHIFRRQEIYDTLDTQPFLIRPANYPESAPGKGWCTVDRGRVQLTVINLMGVAFMDALNNPFEVLEETLCRAHYPRLCVVDFHAEATAEKKAMGFYADGKVSALFGTHTHVMTADEQILPKGTGYITDIGMTGPELSVLGICPQQAIEKLKNKMPVRFTAAPGDSAMNAVWLDIDDKTGKTTGIERLTVS